MHMDSQKALLRFNPFSANVGHARHDAHVTCSGCSRQNTGKIIKNDVFLKEEKIYYKMVYYTSHLS